MNQPTQDSEGVVDENHPPLESMKARVPFGLFFVAAIAQFAIALLVFWLVAPRVFLAELSHPWLILLWTFAFGMPLSLFEYLYHRYLLHSAVLPFLGAMQRAHVTHHGLTNVKAPVKASEPEKLATVTSEFPVEEQHQEESMMFPLYSGVIFIAVFMLILGLPLKLLFPSQPILFSLICTVMAYYSAYEVWHALLHLPFERFWQPHMDRPVVRRVYGFHLMHHWRPTSNLAIVGFWGVALWDHIFNTHRRPERMPLDKAQVTYIDSRLSKPRWPISMFDGWQGGMARAARSVERNLAAIFRRQQHPQK
jgi:hypothetical protein